MPAPLRVAAQRIDTYVRRRLQPVVETGRVERRPFASRLPAFDAIWTTHGLFGRAERYFRRTRRLMPLRLPDPPAIMHWTYPLPIRMVGAKNLYTFHDLVPLRLPYATLDRKRAYRRLMAAVAARADAIVTVSEASRGDLLTWLDVPPERIVNTYQALPDTIPATGGAEVFGLRPQGYFLYFGAVEPKKNVGRLLEAFLASDVSAPLVLVGARAWAAERELRLASGGAGGGAGGLLSPYARRLARRVIRLDYLPRRLLMGLVRDARAVLFPSLYEGFGLPVLEAMRLGTPVLTSTTASLPEVAGHAALLVDPYDVSALAAGIVRLDRDDALRADLARRGPLQADLFSPARYQQRLSALYQGVLA
jgi:glycosyltransferase involved in cell wall biosynthesis